MSSNTNKVPKFVVKFVDADGTEKSLCLNADLPYIIRSQEDLQCLADKPEAMALEVERFMFDCMKNSTQSKAEDSDIKINQCSANDSEVSKKKS